MLSRMKRTVTTLTDLGQLVRQELALGKKEAHN
jgi:hypothetical protein